MKLFRCKLTHKIYENLDKVQLVLSIRNYVKLNLNNECHG